MSESVTKHSKTYKTLQLLQVYVQFMSIRVYSKWILYIFSLVAEILINRDTVAYLLLLNYPGQIWLLFLRLNTLQKLSNLTGARGDFSLR